METENHNISRTPHPGRRSQPRTRRRNTNPRPSLTALSHAISSQTPNPTASVCFHQDPHARSTLTNKPRQLQSVLISPSKQPCQILPTQLYNKLRRRSLTSPSPSSQTERSIRARRRKVCFVDPWIPSVRHGILPLRDLFSTPCGVRTPAPYV
jgi:hypothetical protein